MGRDLQGSDDNGGGDRSSRSPLRHPGTQYPELSSRTGQKGERRIVSAILALAMIVLGLVVAITAASRPPVPDLPTRIPVPFDVPRDPSWRYCRFWGAGLCRPVQQA